MGYDSKGEAVCSVFPGLLRNKKRMTKRPTQIQNLMFSDLLMTMGKGRVRMKMPQRAQRPPISFPGKVDGESSP